MFLSRWSRQRRLIINTNLALRFWIRWVLGWTIIDRKWSEQYIKFISKCSWGNIGGCWLIN